MRRLRDVFAAMPYAATLGAEVAALGRDRARIVLRHRDDNGNRNGMLHGGVLASLVVMGGALAAWTDVDGEPPLAGTTIDLAVHYLAPVTRLAVTVDADVRRRGRELVFVDVEVTAGARTPVARGLVAYRPGLPRLPPAAGGPGASAALPAGVVLGERRSGSAFTRRLGILSARLAPGHAVAVLPCQPAIGDGHGRIHEGALATLVDCVGGASAWSVGGFDPRGRAATVSMHLTYDPAPADGDVIATARTPWQSAGFLMNSVALAGRTSGRPVAAGAVTYRITRPARG